MSNNKLKELSMRKSMDKKNLTDNDEIIILKRENERLKALISKILAELAAS